MLSLHYYSTKLMVPLLLIRCFYQNHQSNCTYSHAEKVLLCSYLVAFCGHQVSCPENIPCTCCLSGFVSTRSLLIYTMTVFPFCVLPKHQVNRPNCCICAHGFAVTKTLLRNSLGFFSSPKLGQISGRFIPIAYVCSVFLNLPTIWQVVW